MDINSAIAAELRAERAAARMTIDALAAAASIPRRTLIRLLNGERDINVSALSAIAEALGVMPFDVYVRAEARAQRAVSGGRAPAAAAPRSGSKQVPARQAHARLQSRARGDAGTRTQRTE